MMMMMIVVVMVMMFRPLENHYCIDYTLMMMVLKEIQLQY